ncbi:MAG TPA: M28 family peptidase [Nitrospira sp.]|nr:M28 family peptidase [Nitrospira sp.]
MASTRRARILRHLNALIGERHHETSAPTLLKAAGYLQAEWNRCGWTTKRESVRVDGHAVPNVLAARHPPGRNLDRRLAPLLVGAHYDTVAGSPGADDNASGLVVLLEVAERLKDIALSRPVWLVAFCFEEQGLHGSVAFAARLKAERRSLTGAIILECVGYASDEQGSQHTPAALPIPVPKTGNFLGLVGNEASSAFLASVGRCMRQSAPSLPLVPLTIPGKGEALPDVRRSDHAALWDHGFPAVMLTDTANFRNPHYHRPTDELDTLNLDFLEQVIDAVTGTVGLLVGQGLHE